MGSQKTKKIIRQFQGIVTSDKMDKTRVVIVSAFKWHPKYKKQYKSSKKYKVHDEKNLSRAGNEVIFQECRPLSKDKRWRLIKIVK
ncbi:MAG: 30S ribosomal protein S17 [Candidatus Parcubacteria bacterium]|nr:30S ribosomal protein S17 [Candidatus Parcubacteria bacterium]